MSSLLWNLALALAWVAITGDLSGGNLVFGFGLGFLVLFFTAPILGRPTYVRKVIQVLNLALFFVWELVLANLRVAYEVLTPGYQLRRSPVGFRSQWHCTPIPQWVFILAGEMEIGLRDGTSRVFRPGEHFVAADTVPPGAEFDAELHGHWSAQRGADALVTLFLRIAATP